MRMRTHLFRRRAVTINDPAFESLEASRRRSLESLIVEPSQLDQITSDRPFERLIFFGCKAKAICGSIIRVWLARVYFLFYLFQVLDEVVPLLICVQVRG